MKRQEALRILGLNGFPSAGEIDRAYKDAARRTHPDSGGSREMFEEVSRARHVLLAKRRDKATTIVVKKKSWLRRRWQAWRRPPRVQ